MSVSAAVPTTTLDALRGLQALIGRANAAKGFHARGDGLRLIVAGQTRYEEQGRLSIDEELADYYVARLALITTEVAEAIEEIRHGREVDETWYSAKVGGTTYAWADGEKPEVLDSAIGKPEGVPSELADVVIRAFDFADEAGIDLAAVIDEKLTYNATRAFKHGKVL